MSFQEVKNGLLNDLAYAGQANDTLWQSQYVEFLSTIEKVRSWETLEWQVNNAPEGLIRYKQFGKVIWLKAIKDRIVPRGAVTARFRKRQGYDILSKDYMVKRELGGIEVRRTTGGYWGYTRYDREFLTHLVEWMKIYMPEIFSNG